MRGKEAATIGLLSAGILILALGFTFPTKCDFDVRNSKWNGLSELQSRYETVRVSNLKTLQDEVIEPSQSTLLLIGPTKPFTAEEAGEVKSFLRFGGRVVLADDFGSGNDLLEELGVNGRFSNLFLKDYVFQGGDPKLPVVENVEVFPLTENVSSISLNYATTLSGLDENSRILAQSSSFSYIVENADQRSENSEAEGPLPVLAEVEAIRGENGRLILLSDPSVFINAMLERENNRALLKSLMGGKRVYIDTDHWGDSRFSKFKEGLHGFGDLLSNPLPRYAFLLSLAVIIFKVGWGKQDEEPKVEKNELEEVSTRHPDWDKEVLRKLAEETEDGN